MTIVPPRSKHLLKTRHGAVAQLGERRVRNAKVRGSIPLGSTKLDVLAQILTVFSISGTVMCSRGFARSKAARIAWASTSRR